MRNPGDWFVPLTEDSGPRLFALPHAGAGVAQLAAFARAANASGVSVWGANLPGRQARVDEAPRTDFAGVVEELADALAPLLDRPYTLFGYCGGALLSFGLVRALRGRGALLPVRLAVASHEAPDIARRPAGLARLPSELFWAHLQESGGVPASLSGDQRLRRMAEPAVRADFAMLAGYRHVVEPALPVLVTVFHGSADSLARGALLGWRRQTTYPLEIRTVQAGHWLLDEAYEELADQLAELLAGDRELRTVLR